MISITGHTSGIGKRLEQYFSSTGSVVLGFSKSNGYDIKIPESRKKIVAESADCSIFINNAYQNYDRSQMEMLNDIFISWKNDPDKLIINISSRWTTEKNNPYCTTKLELDTFCTENIYSLPRIINLKPGLIDTPRVKFINNKKMNAESLINVLDFALKNKNEFVIHSVTFGI